MDNATIAATIDAIVEELVETAHAFPISDDAGEWFGVEAWNGFVVESVLESRSVKGEPSMGAVWGDIAITDPSGGRHLYKVVTSRFGDVEAVKV
jgi:hypothetical protein